MIKNNNKVIKEEVIKNKNKMYWSRRQLHTAGVNKANYVAKWTA